MSLEPRMFAPATARNRDPILDVLRQVLPGEGRVLEIASGTGEHVAHFAGALPHLDFQPTEPDAERRCSIDAWVAGLDNVRPAIALDAAADAWGIGQCVAVLCINMIHIAPWQATRGLMRGASNALAAGGVLVLYGPFRRCGSHTAESNAAFDVSLQARNPAWGVRDLEAVSDEAAQAGFLPPDTYAMPANNLTVVFRKA
ncbi:MAG: DUF938 domain-containing protein [Alphaproteobacteria bacterium]|nr:DUF938 domain-containing protein [Alphaproteobacteria bacterium]